MNVEDAVEDGKAHPLASLSWAGLSDEEFIERVTQRVVDSDNYHGDRNRSGVTRGKVAHFVLKFGAHLSKKDRVEMVNRVFRRAVAVYDEFCAEKAQIVLQRLAAATRPPSKAIWRAVNATESSPARERVYQLVVEHYTKKENR